MAHSGGILGDAEGFITSQSWRVYLTVLLVAAIIYLGCIVSPPSLMDDVDAIQAQIARNMLKSGDWVTARLDGVAYLEKAPLIYWIMAISYRIFGVHAQARVQSGAPDCTRACAWPRVWGCSCLRAS